MTREEAEASAAALNREHPERSELRWFAKRDGDGGGEWSVAHVRLAHRRSERTVRAQAPKPGMPPDEHPLDLPGGLPPWGVGG